MFDVTSLTAAGFIRLIRASAGFACGRVTPFPRC